MLDPHRVMSDHRCVVPMRAILAGSLVLLLCSCGSASGGGQETTGTTTAHGREVPAFLAVVQGPGGAKGFVVETLSARGRILRVLGQTAGPIAPPLAPEWTHGDSEAIWLGPRGLIARGVNGGAARTVVPCGASCPTSFALSPDWTTVLFARDVGLGSELVTASLATGKETVLVPSVAKRTFDVYGGWSPDGKSILYERWTPKEAFLEIARRDGRDSRVLLRLKNPWVLQASWSPDGHRVAFFQDSGPRGWIRPGIVNVSSGHVLFLAAQPDEPGPPASAWAPDSQRLAVSAVRPPRACCGDGIAVFAPSGKLLHFTPHVTAEWLTWTRSGLYSVDGPYLKAVSRSVNGMDAPVRVFRLKDSRLTLLAVVPR